jgi:Yip1-like protein
MALIDRVKNILVTPKSEWLVIAGENPSVQSLYVDYVLILAAIGPIAVALRFGLFGAGIGVALISYAVGLAMVYLLAWIVDALAPSFGGEKNFVRSLQLVAYSFTAAWVAGIFHLLPVVGSLLALAAAIYSLYTFYLGAPILKRCSQEKAVAYTIVVVLCAIVLGSVLSYVVFSVFMGGAMMGMMGAGMMH